MAAGDLHIFPGWVKFIFLKRLSKLNRSLFLGLSGTKVDLSAVLLRRIHEIHRRNLRYFFVFFFNSHLSFSSPLLSGHRPGRSSWGLGEGKTKRQRGRDTKSEGETQKDQAGDSEKQRIIERERERERERDRERERERERER